MQKLLNPISMFLSGLFLGTAVRLLDIYTQNFGEIFSQMSIWILIGTLIACCGLDCEACDARIATLTNNNILREKTAALWTKLNGVTITPEMMNCTGCRIDGAKTPFCDKLCSVHNCVREKRLDICADYAQMDVCQELGCITSNNPSAMENLKQLRRSKQAEEETAENVAGMTLLEIL